MKSATREEKEQKMTSLLESMFVGRSCTLSRGFLLAQVVACGLLSYMIYYVMSFHIIQHNTLIDAMAFYGYYHQHPTNQLIHLFGVPGIQYTSILLLAHLPLPFLNDYTWALPVFCFFLIYYLCIDPYCGGILYIPIIYGMYVSSTKLANAEHEPKDDKKSDDNRKSSSKSSYRNKVLKYAVYVHLFCWYIQIHIGHKIYEGNKPALLDSLGTSLTSAPLFAFYELLWFMGVNTSLQDQTQLAILEYAKSVSN